MRKSHTSACLFTVLTLVVVVPLVNGQAPKSGERIFYKTEIGYANYLGDNTRTPFGNDGTGEGYPYAVGLELGYHLNDAWSASLAYILGNYPLVSQFGVAADSAAYPNVRGTVRLFARRTFNANQNRLAPFIQAGLHVTSGTTRVLGMDRIFLINDDEIAVPDAGEERRVAFGPLAGLGLDVRLAANVSLLLEANSHLTFGDGAVDGRTDNGFGSADLLTTVGAGLKIGFPTHTTEPRNLAWTPGECGLFLRPFVGLTYYVGDNVETLRKNIEAFDDGIPWNRGVEIGYDFDCAWSFRVRVDEGQYRRATAFVDDPVAAIYDGGLAGSPLKAETDKALDVRQHDLGRLFFQVVGRRTFGYGQRAAAPYVEGGVHVGFGDVEIFNPVGSEFTETRSEVYYGPVVGAGFEVPIIPQWSLDVGFNARLTFPDTGLDGYLDDDVKTRLDAAGFDYESLGLSDSGGLPFDLAGNVNLGLIYRFKERTQALELVETACPESPVLAMNETATFTAIVNDTSPELAAQWEFGDGTSSSGTTAAHSYTQPGAFTALFTAENERGSVSTECRVRVIEPVGIESLNVRPPVVNTCLPLSPVTFNATAKGSEPIQYAWDFGDGNTSNEKAPSHTYQEAGTYNASLMVLNEAASDSQAVSISVGACDRPGTLLVVQDEESSSDIAAGRTVEVILDASGSMLRRQDGQRRIDIAREALLDLTGNVLPEGTPFALRIFGHREAGSCRTDLEIPLQPLNAAAAANTIRTVQARNRARTPIARSLERIEEDVRGAEGQLIVILVTDGEETCDGDPEQAIRKLQESGIDVRVNIVGFAIDDAVLKQTFSEWARLGGGRYYDVQGAGDLGRSIVESLRVPFELVNTNGETVASGIVGETAVEVPPGTYTLRVLSSPIRQVTNVIVSSDSETRINLNQAGQLR